MMNVDIHQHPYPGVHEIMARDHIDVTVLLPGRGQNELVLQWARKWPGQFVPFYWVELDEPERAADELRQAVEEHGHKGIKFQPLVQRFYANEPRLRPIFATAQELGIPVLFHTGVVAFDRHFAPYASPLPIDELAGEFPELRIIIAHLGGNYSFEAVVIAQKNPNVYMDTAYLHFFCDRSLPPVRPIDLIRRAVEFAGPEKVLFGGEGIRPSLILDSQLRPDHKKMILWQNARRLLGLGEPDWIGNEL